MRKAAIAIWLGCCALLRFAAAAEPVQNDWRHYLGAQDSSGYSSLAQINRSNVGQLQVAWSYSAGQNPRLRFNPIVVDGVMYVLGRNGSIVALDAASGKQLWSYEPDPLFARDVTDRGINYWENKDRSDRRLLFAAGVYLHAIDAGSGKLITSFGKDGRVDLREGLGRDPLSVVQIGFNSPGRTFENLLIVGSRPGEAYTAAPGDIRAYDVRTGKLAWTFHTIPHPGEFGYETWPKDAWKTSGAANVWADLTLDEKRGIIYAPTGSPTYDFYGADRKGANLFGDCLLALDARTGKRLWHFQTVHHDLWDYDNPSAPQLITVRHAGKMVDAVALAGKTGFLYVFDRVTGTPLWPIEERPVPRSDTPGEQAWPTQPFPTQPPPFARQSLTAKDVNPYIESASERSALIDRIQSARNEGLFTPPGTRETIQIPGGQGGANWGTTAADPAGGIVYVLSKDQPSMLKLEQAPPRTGSQSGSPEQIGQRTYQQRCQGCHATNLEGRPPEIPSLVDVTMRLDAAAIKRTVIVGRGSMPAFDVADPELNALVAYFKRPAAGAPTWPVASSAVNSVPSVQAKPDGPTRYWSGYGFMTSSVGSAISPPWSTLTAYDLNAGTIKWQVALGDEPALGARGIKNTGSGSPRGAVVTAGGLIFSGTLDRKIRAFDKDTGKTLWEKELPIVPLSVAATYELGGKQYLVIAGSPSARGAESAYIVFALPGAVK